MDNKNINNNIEGEATWIELILDSTQNLEYLRDNPFFTNFILLKSYNSIIDAIRGGLDKVELFNVFNMSITIELDKTQYHLVLKKAIDYFISIEDYEECEKIKNLINKL